MNFCDLNQTIKQGDALHSREQATMALRLGWTTIASTHHAQDRLSDRDRCTLQPVPWEALAAAVQDATPALKVANSLLRRPGSGKGRKKHKNLAEAASQSERAAMARAAAAASATDSAARSWTPGHQSRSNSVKDRDAGATVLASADAALPDDARPASDNASLLLRAPISGSTSAAVSAIATATCTADNPARSTEPTSPSTSKAVRESLSAVTLKDADIAPVQPLQQLRRLTFATDDVTLAMQLDARPDITEGYDIVAIEPLSERVMQQACMSLKVDLITFSFSKRLSFRFKPTLLQAAVERGLHFEICYASLLNPSNRRTAISNAQVLARATRGRGIVVSSGAKEPFTQRGPADVANIATFFGLTQQQAKVAITEAPAAVVRNGVTRRATKGSLLLQRAVPHSTVPAAQPAVASPNGRAEAAAGSSPVGREQQWTTEAAALLDISSGPATLRVGPKPLRQSKQQLGPRGGVQKMQRASNGQPQQQQQQQPKLPPSQQQPQQQKMSKKQRKKARLDANGKHN